jgi:hypothetical protein
LEGKKTRVAHLLTLAVLFVNIPIPAFAQAELATNPGDPILIRRSNPKLADVEKLWIDVQMECNSVDANFLLVDQIRRKCSEKLQRAGVVVTSDPNLCSWSANSKIPVFKIRINVFDINIVPTCIFYAKSSFSRMVTLTTESGPILYKADVWESKSVMQSAVEQELPEVLTDVILRQVDVFIVAWSSANAPDVNRPWPQSRKADVRQEAKPAKQQGVETNFVASKNSQVFHKPSCPFAQKIASKNRVSYSSREEAIAAGKRPCKSCNP